ncbi:hypothetical protein MM300_19410 [Evansella sp. LMS18]|jgi:hypothetical protein|uniref:hypothetical protein n=1 Tax=Evansella sp. LMS18 TaxID=2924033 RepID=UPI0020D04690|nr:hypothetical protein [Evansella sp. LMS18]UTR10022.1 hypothetical protein MM300_19410 [Evansella sp. LMS18]
MLMKMKNTGEMFLGIGLSLMVAHFFDLFSFPYIYAPLIILGLPLVIIPALKTKTHNSLLCRIGMHKFIHLAWDDEIKYVAIYECERCKKRKKVVRSGG